MPNAESSTPSGLEEFRARARAWLSDHAAPRHRSESSSASAREVVAADVAVFHDLTFDEEAALLNRIMAWQQAKCDAGFGAITWPPEYGGQGLPPAFQDAFDEEETHFEVPPGHETFSVTLNLIAPTIHLLGSERQKRQFVRRFVRTEELCCQLFSEPSAGSDLASVGTSAVRTGDGWVISGQKVWSSGAKHAAWGELLTRTDPDAPKHAGMTAFVIPMDASGIEIRPIRQMSGGSSFNEVFFDDVRILDSDRLGPVGGGWKVALTTLGFERGDANGTKDIGGSWAQTLALVHLLERSDDPLVRQQLAAIYMHDRLRTMNRLRSIAVHQDGQPPGTEGSLMKLAWVRQLDRISQLVSTVLGPHLTADVGQPGAYCWTAHVLGALGYHIAGGSDEIQHNILAERALGLPAEPRLDRNTPWRDIPK